MKTLVTFMRWDVILLSRNKLFLISAVVAAAYTGIFFILKPLGNLTNIVIILIFNDPVITGFLFAGVLLLFDKNQNTLQAISVLPIQIENYILSKSIILSLLAFAISFIMSVASVGLTFNVVHLFFAVFFSTLIFSFGGFILGSLSANFNQFLSYAIPFLIVSSVPVISVFGFVSFFYLIPLPTMGSMCLIKGAFMEAPDYEIIICYIQMIVWLYISWKITIKITKKTIS